MNATEMEYTIKLAARIEADAAELYEAFATLSPAGSREHQFWQLLSYEEKTHSQVMELIAERLDPDLEIPADDTPVALHNNLHGLRQFQSWIRDCKKATAHMTGDQAWMARLATDLETSEADKVLDWLMHLPLPEDTRTLIEELIRGTTDHASRVAAFAASQVPTSALPACY